MAARRLCLAACVAVSMVLSGPNVSAQEQDALANLAGLQWQTGPAKGDLGGIASIDIPEGYQFVGKGGASKFMEFTQNPSDGRELGVLIGSNASWFVVFTFSDEGYVKDTDRNLDADAILSSIREGTEQANKLRAERGWSALQVVGWNQAPFYDPQTNNLTWSIIGKSEGNTSVNHSTRLLGRRGVMNVDLVMSPEELLDAVPEFNAVLTGFSFNSGQRYAEFTAGDKVAQYGLAGLIVGGAGVALAKTGLLKKFGKLIIAGIIALVGAIARLFKGRKAQTA